MKQLIVFRNNISMPTTKYLECIAEASDAYLRNLISNNTQVKYPNRHYVAGHGECVYYLRSDLQKMAEQAEKEGKHYFCVKPANPDAPHGKLVLCDDEYQYQTNFQVTNDLFEQYIAEPINRTVTAVENIQQLLDVIKLAQDLGLQEGFDYFPICQDQYDTNPWIEQCGNHVIYRGLVCIGFKPLSDDIVERLTEICNHIVPSIYVASEDATDSEDDTKTDHVVSSFGGEEYVKQYKSMRNELDRQKFEQSKLLEHYDTPIGDRKDSI